MTIDVMAGINDIVNGNPQYRATVESRDIRAHPNYNRDTLVNDIGLVFVLNRIPFSNAMNRIALPPRAHANNRFIGSTGTVIGWGRVSDGKKIFFIKNLHGRLSV